MNNANLIQIRATKSYKSQDLEAIPAFTAESVMLKTLENWDPGTRPIHCSNCIHARVRQRNQENVGEAICRKIPECKPVTVVLLSRTNYPRGFRDASKCNDFEPAE